MVGIGRGGRAAGRSDRGKVNRRRTQTLGRDLPLDLGPLSERCAELSVLSTVKPRAYLCRGSWLDRSGGRDWRPSGQARALALAESSAHHHFGLRNRLDYRNLRVSTHISSPCHRAGSPSPIWL